MLSHIVLKVRSRLGRGVRTEPNRLLDSNDKVVSVGKKFFINFDHVARMGPPGLPTSGILFIHVLRLVCLKREW